MILSLFSYLLTLSLFNNNNKLHILLQVYPEAEFNVVSDSGHSAKEVGTTHILVEAADKYSTL